MARAEVDLNKYHSLVAAIAKETDSSLEEASEAFRIEHSKLEEVARIQTYVPVIAGRRARNVLRQS